MLMKYEELSKELASLKQEMQPFFKHILHDNENEECECLPKYKLPVNKVSKISELLWEASKNSTKFYVRNLKLVSEIKMLNVSIMKQSNPNLEVDDHVPTELIQRLESLVNEDINIPKQNSPFLVDSPFLVNIMSPEHNTCLEFSPVVARSWLKINNPPIKLDVESVADLIAPVKVGVPPSLPLSGHIIGSVQRQKLKPNETILSIAQRMSSKVTPRNFGKHKNNTYSDSRTCSSSMIIGRHPKDITSFSKEETKLVSMTPLLKAQMPVASQTTGRRLSSAFVKPGSCFVRRQLNTNTPQLKIQSTHETHKLNTNKEKQGSSKPKSKDQEEDDMLNMMVKKIMAEEVSEDSFSRNDSDILDSSLSGVECISSTPWFGNEMHSVENSGFLSPIHSNVPILKEILEDDVEILAAVNSFKEECSRTEPSECEEQFDEFLNPEEMNKMYDSFHEQKELDTKKKTGRDSIGALVEKFNAIMAKTKKK